VRIADPVTGATVAPDVIGEICTRGYLVMHGYLDDPAATRAAIDADGWLHTGDLGSMDQRGYCRIEGRIKEMIIRGGENIYPREIEAVLLSHPGVADAAVVGVADRFWGEEVGAVIRASADNRPRRQNWQPTAAAGWRPSRSPAAGCSRQASPSTHRERSARTC
jgi:acyl-CoA synthetase (AMP-forming)/AMP-acid ligase II